LTGKVAVNDPSTIFLNAVFTRLFHHLFKFVSNAPFRAFADMNKQMINGGGLQ